MVEWLNEAYLKNGVVYKIKRFSKINKECPDYVTFIYALHPVIEKFYKRCLASAFRSKTRLYFMYKFRCI